LTNRDERRSIDEEDDSYHSKGVLRIAAIIVFPFLILLAFYSSLNVTATNGPIFANFTGFNNLFSRPTINFSETTLPFGNQSSFENASFPVLLPQIPIPSSVLITIILLLFFVVSISVLLNLRRQNSSQVAEFDSDTELQKERSDVADILDRTILELRQGGEYRQTVLECYRKICDILEFKSKINGISLTAREFEVLVSSRLKLDSPYLSQITDVFEVARYSRLEISRAEADTAIDCLSNLSLLLRDTRNTSFKG
jgi:hypothetical protein